MAGSRQQAAGEAGGRQEVSSHTNGWAEEGSETAVDIVEANRQKGQEGKQAAGSKGSTHPSCTSGSAVDPAPASASESALVSSCRKDSCWRTVVGAQEK